MKKKITVAVLLILSLCLLLCGCNNVNGKLGKLAKAPYKSVKLTVNVKLGGAELNSVYYAENIDGEHAKIEYEYQVFNEIKEENGSYVLPEERVSTFKGSATVERNGKNATVEQNGEKSDVSLKEITAKNLDFSKGNFSDVKEEEGRFSANIKNVSRFLGSGVSAEKADVTVVYSENALISVTVNITTKNGALVVATYAFGDAE